MKKKEPEQPYIIVEDNPIHLARPCPFCGGNDPGTRIPKIDWDEDCLRPNVYSCVECKSCGAQGPVVRSEVGAEVPDVMSNAVDAWGRKKGTHKKARKIYL